MRPPTVSVVVPSYRRPTSLVRCLDGLLAQSRPAAQVVVVRRDADTATADAVRPYRDRVDEVVVSVPGVLSAMGAGMAAAWGDVIAFTDDDAVARPTWLERLVVHYDAADVGGVGGRDDLHPADGSDIPSARIGRITRWGKLVGEHHRGVGPAVDVDVLKGVNMSFRREALALPRELRGMGAQVHFEIATSLWAKARGWRLVYDPAAVVDHYPGPRFDNDRRGRPDREATRNEAYNLVWATLSFRPAIRWRRTGFGLLVGDRATPGAARAAVALLQGDVAVARRVGPSIAGQLGALAAGLRGQRPDMVTAPPHPVPAAP